ncbi:MAG: hypothetical protein FWE03_04215 [Firmicutes bacterium]|nr:hypothetical protein [Bacillota bacterium]
MKKRSILKAFFILAILLSVALSAFSMTACTAGDNVDPEDPNIHQVFFLANGGRFGGGSYEQILLFRDRAGGGRIAGGHVSVPIRRGYSFNGWFEIDQEHVSEVEIERVTNTIDVPGGDPIVHTVKERFFYVQGHNYSESGQHPLTFADLGREVALDDYGNRLYIEDADGNIMQHPDENLFLFKTGTVWNFDLDEINVSGYQVDEDDNQITDTNGNPVWLEPRTIFIALWQPIRTFVILPTHTQVYRDLDPNNFDPDSENNYDAVIAALTDPQARNALRRRNVRMDGSLSRRSLEMIAYNRPGFQIAGFYADSQFRTPLAFNAAGIHMPLMQFIQDEEGNDTEVMTTVVVFVRHIDANFLIIDSIHGLQPTPGSFHLIPIAGRNPYFTSDIDLGGAVLNIPQNFNGVIRGNRRTISNFVVNVEMQAATPQNFQDNQGNVLPAVHGGLFNQLGAAAHITDITFDNFIINFIHTDTHIPTDTRGPTPSIFRPNDGPYLGSYHPERRQVINVFAASVAAGTRARNVTMNFGWREQRFVGTGTSRSWFGFGWEGRNSYGEVDVQYIYDQIVGMNPDHDDDCGCDDPDCRDRFIWAARPDSSKAVGQSQITGLRQFDLPDYRFRTDENNNPYFLEFAQVGDNFGDYFYNVAVLNSQGEIEEQTVLGLYGGSDNTLNLRANNLGNMQPSEEPLYFGRTITTGMDLSIFNYEFEGYDLGLFNHERFIGWFIIEQADILAISDNRVEPSDFELFWEGAASHQLQGGPRRGRMANYIAGEDENGITFNLASADLNGLFVVPMWRV